MSKEASQEKRKGLRPWVLLLILAWLSVWAYQSYQRRNAPDFDDKGVSKYCADPDKAHTAEGRKVAEECNAEQRHHAETGKWYEDQ